MIDVSLPQGLTLVAEPLPAIQISTAALDATVTLQGAQIIAWQPADAAPVLYLSEHSRWQPGAPIRGGIPVCFPWFGGGRNHLATAAGHPDAATTMAPSHGWARVSDWALVEAGVAADGTATLTFELSGAVGVGKPHDEQFPADATVRYTMHLGTDLRLEFEVIAGQTLVDIETLLHTYLAVEDITEVTIIGLGEVAYWDKVNEQTDTGAAELIIDGETDRVYDTSPRLRVVTPQRTLEISTTGAGSTVVWNPWTDKAKEMPDFGDDDYHRMVCVESGNVLTQAITVAPGDSHMMAVTYRIR